MNKNTVINILIDYQKIIPIIRAITKKSIEYIFYSLVKNVVTVKSVVPEYTLEDEY
jgi:hypothetical protein